MTDLRESALGDLLALYTPNVKGGNYQADVSQRGGNRMLARAIVTLDLATADEVEALFRERDEQAWRESQERLARFNARIRSEGK